MSYGEWYKYHTAIGEEGKGKHKEIKKGKGICTLKVIFSLKQKKIYMEEYIKRTMKKQ